MPHVEITTLVRMAPLVLVLALLPLAWWWLRARGADTRVRLAALTALTLFLTFDLIVFGAFTRLSDSGLGCPDWPGCYGEASPFGARADITAAQSALPTGPVTWNKAWIEMVHRYLAMTVGVLIVVMTAVSWRQRRVLPHSPWWPTLTLAWVVAQGLFGKYTVTLKLYPAIVTLHLLGGMALLALLAIQREAFRDRALTMTSTLRRAALGVFALLLVQIALGGWVSTNYAVLACQGFPTCNGQWWPAMNVDEGFTLLRHLGRAGHGGWLSLDALVAIHMVHRLFAVAVLAALAGLAWCLRSERSTRRYAALIAWLSAAQLATGLSNVVLGWPLAGALLHTAGAAALVWVLTSLLARPASAPRWARRADLRSAVAA